MSVNNSEHKGIILLKKGQKGLIHAVFSRFGLFALLLIAQFVALFSIFQWLGEFLPQIWGGSVILTSIMVLYLINTRLDPSAKITWLIIILLLPIFGSLLFFYTQSDFGHHALVIRLNHLIAHARNSIPQSEETREHFAADCPDALPLANYIHRTGCFPIYDHCDVTYFPSGEAKFEELLRQLERAEHFIFLEYFIVDEGEMWGQVLEILARKAKQGVEVRVMYDGTCEFMLLPRDYPKRLHQLGIQCKVFAPVTPFVSTHYNYRDHRKILVIDGHTAFTGGINLADEYINRVTRHGHWKDTAIMVQGEATKSFTLLFLQLWNISGKDLDFERFLSVPIPQHNAPGYVIPYGDYPLDNDKVGERVYMDLLNRARHYVHIMTPYLILDSTMETAIKFAAERGVEVVLILPGIPDKKAPYALAKTHYASLLASGVHIFEYTPGFVHAKVFVSDDREAVVGTINLDYRSLYHHFECAAYLNGTSCIPDIEADFQATLAQCRPVTTETIRHEAWHTRILGWLLKGIAPLL